MVRGREAPRLAVYGPVDLSRAVAVVEAFEADHPTGKVGIRERVVYCGKPTLWVYRSRQGTIIVRGG